MTGYKDALLVLSTYPDPTPEYIVDQAADIADRLGCGLSALVLVLERRKIARSYPRYSLLLDVPGMIDEALVKSSDHADELLRYFEKTATHRGVLREQIRVGTSFFASSDLAANHARTYDFTILPVGSYIGFGEMDSEDVIFDSGRPTLLLPINEDSGTPTAEIDKVVVGWDRSRTAARALADAIPILARAKQIHVVTVTNEKEITEGPSDDDLDRYLKARGIAAVIESVDSHGKSAGATILDYVRAHQANLLVMGAYGHNRIREFILGGATRTILHEPPIPVFLSH